ncbi:MAG: DNA translocase FtsK, partial [Mogibacterium sp.]|nr:DNA translocase FtsK [Mogibacterium sp.]
MEIGELLVKFFGKPGLLIIAIAAVLICVLLVFNTPISKAITNYSNKREEKRLLKELEEVEKERLLAEKKTALIESRASQSSANDDLQNTTEIMSSPLNGISKFFKSPDAVEKDSKAIIELSRDEGPIGTEAASQTEFGKGLADINENKHAEKSYGLEGNTSTKAGFGLDGYESMFGLGGESLPESKGLDMTAPMTPASVALAAAAAHVFDDEAEDNTKAPKASKPSSRSKTKVAEEVNTDEIANELVSGFCNGEADPSYKLPSIELLKKGRGSKQMMTNYELEQKAVLLQKTLRDFKVESTILNVTQGSSVTRYEVQPATGVKVSKITELANDIALNLRAKSVRIEAPIPGKAAVGIEVENEKPTPVLIRDLIESDEFQSSASKITFVVGKDISGNNIVADLKTMPHLLIAGATGSGKSVCINSIIASLLYKAKPSEVKLIMIDPKVVELGNYNGIPHLLTSVVTDPRKAARALAEAVAEMNKRYEEFAKMGVKDLESYNELMIANQEPQNVKPQVVIIIDELADLMMAAKSQVEESIARLAQKARAAGMHLIIATQRPSVDVVTGLIKANVPSRIAFSVASQIDSRTILDMGGAESLLGRGDMLFSPIGSSKPYRVQGPYISDSEIAKLINYVKGQGKAQYDENLSNA